MDIKTNDEKMNINEIQMKGSYMRKPTCAQLSWPPRRSCPRTRSPCPSGRQGTRPGKRRGEASPSCSQQASLSQEATQFYTRKKPYRYTRDGFHRKMQTRNLARVTSTPAKKWNVGGCTEEITHIARFSQTRLCDNKVFPDMVGWSQDFPRQSNCKVFPRQSAVAKFSDKVVIASLFQTRLCYCIFFVITTVYVFRASPRPHIPVFFPHSFFVYVNLIAKGAHKLFPPSFQYGYSSLLLMHTVLHYVL